MSHDQWIFSEHSQCVIHRVIFYHFSFHGRSLVARKHCLSNLLQSKLLFHFEQQMTVFHSFIILLKKTGFYDVMAEGRDKLVKFLIYLFKLIDAVKTLYRHRNTFRFQRIGSHFQKARQFMRFGKFIVEYNSIIKLITQPTRDQFGRLIRIIIHTFFSFYWALDNLTLLASFDLVDIPQFQIHRTSMTIKFVSLSIAALLNVRSWIRLHHAELKARKELKYLKGDDNLLKSIELQDLIKNQWLMFLLCIKIFGDMLPTIAKSAIAKKIFKFQIPRIVQAIGGLCNAFVSCMITVL